jgi:hypothetical protein
MNSDLGINEPTIWKLGAGNGFGLIRPLRPVVPPKQFSLNWRPYPQGGEVKIKSSLIAVPLFVITMLLGCARGSQHLVPKRQRRSSKAQ